MLLIDADELANSVDPVPTAPLNKILIYPICHDKLVHKLGLTIFIIAPAYSRVRYRSSTFRSFILLSVRQLFSSSHDIVNSVSEWESKTGLTQTGLYGHRGSLKFCI